MAAAAAATSPLKTERRDVRAASDLVSRSNSLPLTSRPPRSPTATRPDGSRRARSSATSQLAWTQAQRQHRVRVWFRFCMRHDWCSMIIPCPEMSIRVEPLIVFGGQHRPRAIQRDRHGSPRIRVISRHGVACGVIRVATPACRASGSSPSAPFSGLRCYNAAECIRLEWASVPRRYQDVAS